MKAKYFFLIVMLFIVNVLIAQNTYDYFVVSGVNTNTTSKSVIYDHRTGPSIANPKIRQQFIYSESAQKLSNDLDRVYLRNNEIRRPERNNNTTIVIDDGNKRTVTKVLDTSTIRTKKNESVTTFFLSDGRKIHFVDNKRTLNFN